LSYANLQFIDVSEHWRDVNQALDIPPQKKVTEERRKKSSTQKAFSRFVGTIVETTRHMRAAGDLN
jgi:hypothetical protein